MSERDSLARRAREFFDQLWMPDDPWELESSEFEAARYARQLDLLADRRYQSALEIGCGAGAFTRRLAAMADTILAIDVSEVAIARAQESVLLPCVTFRAVDAMKFDPEQGGPWDLVVLSETIYYLGWLYPFFDLTWFASELYAATRSGGRLLLANTSGGPEHLCRPWIIQTYRDLFVNVGYELQTEECFHGTKHGVAIELLLSVFGKADPARIRAETDARRGASA